MENEFLTDSELLATVADIKAVIKGAKGEKGDSGNGILPNGLLFIGNNLIRNQQNSLSAIQDVYKSSNLKEWYVGCNNTGELFEYTANNGTGLLSVLQIFNDGSIKKIGGGSFSAISDERMKKEIVPFNSGLEKVLAIQPKKFKYNAVEGTPTENYPEIITDKQQYGVIAQDLQNVCPEMVTADENGFLSVDLSNLSLLLINAVKELNTKIGSLEARILALEAPQA